MTHSKNFYKFKKYYDEGLWTIDMLRNTVGKKLGITAAEFEEITGQPY